MEYDEDRAIEFMRKQVPSASVYDDDQLLNVIDAIWDFYENTGNLEIDFDEDAPVDADGQEEDIELKAIVEYVSKQLSKDKGNKVSLDELPALIQAELDFEDTIIDAE